jgi:hypothetical protein
MRFMMMMKCTSSLEAGVPPPPKLMQAISEHAEKARKDGILLSTGALLHPNTGARVRANNGKVTVTDGPFAETKELIGGFAILKAGSRDEAIRMGEEFLQLYSDILGPSYQGEMEIRQMMDEQEMRDFAPEELETSHK